MTFIVDALAVKDQTNDMRRQLVERRQRAATTTLAKIHQQIANADNDKKGMQSASVDAATSIGQAALDATEHLI